MWYAIQTITGNEEKVIEVIQRVVEHSVYERCFLLKREAVWRIRGGCKVHTELLFPGYIFIISGEVECLYQALKQVPQLTKLLGVGEKWTPMTKEDVAIIEALSGEERVVKHSEGYIACNKVTITSGPLMGMEALIRRIDRHKRMAWMEIEIFGRKIEIQAGLEIISKE